MKAPTLILKENTPTAAIEQTAQKTRTELEVTVNNAGINYTEHFIHSQRALN